MHICLAFLYVYFFFFNDTATTEIYTLSLHDALPISSFSMTTTASSAASSADPPFSSTLQPAATAWRVPSKCASSISSGDRKSTRLNSSHANISYAVFCLKKKKYDNAINQQT